MRFLFSILVLLGLMGAGISADSGSGLRSSSGAGSASSPDCMGNPAVDYDARTLPLADAAVVGSFPSSGSLSGWDLSQATSADKPVYEADCGNGVPCLKFADATDYMRSPLSALPWPSFFGCIVFRGTAIADEVIAQWNDSSATVFRNSFVQRTSDYNIIDNTTTVINVGGVVDQWHSYCFDFNGGSSLRYSLDGGAIISVGSTANIDIPTIITVGTGFPRAAAWDFGGGKIGRLSFYNEALPSDLQSMSSCLKTQWNF